MSAGVVERPKVIDITVPRGAVSYRWRCGLCGTTRWETSYLSAHLDAVEHLNEAHACTLIGDGR